MHFVDPSQLTTSGLTNDQRDTVQLIKIDNYKNSMRLNKINRGPVFVDLRTDRDRKTYFQSYRDHTALAGEVLDFSVTYFVGKVDEPTKILSNDK